MYYTPMAVWTIMRICVCKLENCRFRYADIAAAVCILYFTELSYKIIRYIHSISSRSHGFTIFTSESIDLVLKHFNHLLIKYRV